jgi:hypothetical protein
MISKITQMGTMQKIKQSKTRSKVEMIKGLPVLRGMFVCPESLSEIVLSPLPDPGLREKRFSIQDFSFSEDNIWGNNWFGQD